ncbi:hypothetical protein N7447_006938 [Penicillium robsamsonii]|uniref:uncharacterized protein n=1 Tax=Penicillium robsamsonii TaxID=1792511 RepID=UPI00254829CC|nr:uncharacterized protein N7447_006938 [Penicillium robsamsonii]KAJ5824598.1 hypothetical protein N7447_006938 [Penicillium robsamsonii]
MSKYAPHLAVVIMGDVGVGKEALAERFSPNDVHDPTYDGTHMARIDVDGSPCVLNIERCGGKEFIVVRDLLIRHADVFILAYSVTSRTSFSYIRALDNHIKETEERLRADGIIKLCKSPVIFVGTKNDLEAQREVSVEEGQMLAKSLNCPFIETSAKHNTNVKNLFHEAVRCFRQQNPPTPSEPETPTPSRSRKGLGRLLGPRQRNNDNGPRCIVM